PHLKSQVQCTIFGTGHHARWLIAAMTGSLSSMASSEISLEAVSSVSQIPADEWDACANPRTNPGSLNGLDTLASTDFGGNSLCHLTADYNPFVSHAFFAALEA